MDEMKVFIFCSMSLSIKSLLDSSLPAVPSCRATFIHIFLRARIDYMDSLTTLTAPNIARSLPSDALLCF